jgi:NAD(P)H dehydrogenase (quinone)
MNVLIVHAHPEPKSFTAAMKDAAAATLTQMGHAVIVSDLYADGFNPVAGPEDFGERYDDDYLVYSLEQRHNWPRRTIAPDIAREADRVLACDLLILNFPIFWFSVPAIMKGWIDRVFLSGPFYGGRRIYGRAGLTAKRALVAATLGGREHMFGSKAIHGELRGMLRHVLQGTLGYCGFKVVEPFFGYHVPYISPQERSACLERYRDHIRRLDDLPQLAMPRIEDFDERLAPLHSETAGET